MVQAQERADRRGKTATQAFEDNVYWMRNSKDKQAMFDKEKKEHPEFSDEDIWKIVEDHMQKRENWKASSKVLEWLDFNMGPSDQVAATARKLAAEFAMDYQKAYDIVNGYKNDPMNTGRNSKKENFNPGAGGGIDERTKQWIISTLKNDESSTDQELIRHLMSEGKLSQSDAKWWVDRRDYYLQNSRENASPRAKELAEAVASAIPNPTESGTLSYGSEHGYTKIEAQEAWSIIFHEMKKLNSRTITLRNSGRTVTLKSAE